MPSPTDFTEPGVIEDMMSYHKPEGGEPAQYETITKAAIAFAKVIVACTPKCPDQSVAIRAVREAKLWANSAIANKGKY